MRTPAPHKGLAVRYNRVRRQVQRDHGICAGGNCVNCMICLDPVGQNDDRSKTARTDPLQRTLLMWRRVTKRFHYDQITVCYSFTQRLVGGVQIDSDCLVCNMIDNLPDFVTVRTALV